MPQLNRPDGCVIHFEVIGDGDPVLCLGGWGTFCHGARGGLPFGLADNFQTIIMDYRGLGASTDTPHIPASMELYAQDAIAVLDAMAVGPTHLLGMVGIGACICQLIAIRRPDLTRSLVNTGAWCRMDDLLAEQLRLYVDVHRGCGWETFQRLVCSTSFEPEYYLANAARLLGRGGPWSELDGKLDTHQRFIDASLIHDVETALGAVTAPALIFHAGLDTITGPRTTVPIERALPNARGIAMPSAAHVMAGKAVRLQFSDHLFAFYRDLA